jgi:hypothetical protein
MKLNLAADENGVYLAATHRIFANQPPTSALVGCIVELIVVSWPRQSPSDWN